MRYHPGWGVVGATFALLTLAFGSLYSFGTFFESFARDFGAGRGDVALILGLGGLFYFSVGLPAGMLADRIGTRPVVIPGVMLLTAGLIAAGSARSLFEVYAAYAVGIGLGIGCVYVPSISAVQRWFLARRALATGIAATGIGLGTFVGPLIAAGLIGTLGWRNALVTLGAIVGALGLATAWLVDNRPERRGYGVDGLPSSAPRAAAANPATGLTLGEAARKPAFWAIYAGILLFTLTSFVPFAHLVPYARDAGMAPEPAASLLGTIGLGSLIGRFSVGIFADRLGRRRSLALSYLVLGLMSLLWSVSTGYVALAVFAFVHGASYGISVALLPAVISDRFGPRHAGALIGALYTAGGIGSFVAPVAAGYAFDASGSYLVPILVAAVMALLAAAITSRLRG